jgi:hypothetical protein
VQLWFWSLDHEPPHFHAKRDGEWEVKVRFLLEPADMIELKWANKKPAARALRELALLAEEHRLALLKQWEQIQGA